MPTERPLAQRRTRALAVALGVCGALAALAAGCSHASDHPATQVDCPPPMAFMTGDASTNTCTMNRGQCILQSASAGCGEDLNAAVECPPSYTPASFGAGACPDPRQRCCVPSLGRADAASFDAPAPTPDASDAASLDARGDGDAGGAAEGGDA
jgi:hypothetical protein